MPMVGEGWCRQANKNCRCCRECGASCKFAHQCEHHLATKGHWIKRESSRACVLHTYGHFSIVLRAIVAAYAYTSIVPNVNRDGTPRWHRRVLTELLHSNKPLKPLVFSTPSSFLEGTKTQSSLDVDFMCPKVQRHLFDLLIFRLDGFLANLFVSTVG